MGIVLILGLRCKKNNANKKWLHSFIMLDV